MVTEDGDEKGLVDFSDDDAGRTADAGFVGWQWLRLHATLRSLLILSALNCMAFCPQLYGLFLLKFRRCMPMGVKTVANLPSRCLSPTPHRPVSVPDRARSFHRPSCHLTRTFCKNSHFGDLGRLLPLCHILFL